MDLNEQGRTGTPVQTRHFWELARADFLMRLLRRRIGGGEGTLLDFGCVVVHIFSEEMRSFYSLDRLWSDAEKIDYKDFL